MRSMKAVSSRISGGMGLSKWPILCCCSDIDVEVADHHDAAFGTDILLGAAGCCRAAKAALAMR